MTCCDRQVSSLEEATVGNPLTVAPIHEASIERYRFGGAVIDIRCTYVPAASYAASVHCMCPSCIISKCLDDLLDTFVLSSALIQLDMLPAFPTTQNTCELGLLQTFPTSPKHCSLLMLQQWPSLAPRRALKVKSEKASATHQQAQKLLAAFAPAAASPCSLNTCTTAIKEIPKLYPTTACQISKGVLDSQ